MKKKYKNKYNKKEIDNNNKRNEKQNHFTICNNYFNIYNTVEEGIGVKKV